MQKRPSGGERAATFICPALLQQPPRKPRRTSRFGPTALVAGAETLEAAGREHSRGSEQCLGGSRVRGSRAMPGTLRAAARCRQHSVDNLLLAPKKHPMALGGRLEKYVKPCSLWKKMLSGTAGKGLWNRLSHQDCTA